jgi:hypothetical protein
MEIYTEHGCSRHNKSDINTENSVNLFSWWTLRLDRRNFKKCSMINFKAHTSTITVKECIL